MLFRSEFEARVDAHATGVHSGNLLHVGKFKLGCAAVAAAGPGFHRVCVFLGADGRHAVRLDSAPLVPEAPRVYRDEGVLGALAGDWGKVPLAGEVTPRGVLLLGAHVAHNPRPTVYDRTDGQVRNLRVWTAAAAAAALAASPCGAAPGTAPAFGS